MNDLGKAAYNAYGMASDYRTANGDPMPRWDVLPVEFQQAWNKAAEAVLNAANQPLPEYEAVEAAALLPFEDAPNEEFTLFGGEWVRREARQEFHQFFNDAAAQPSE